KSKRGKSRMFRERDRGGSVPTLSNHHNRIHRVCVELCVYGCPIAHLFPTNSYQATLRLRGAITAGYIKAGSITEPLHLQRIGFIFQSNERIRFRSDFDAEINKPLLTYKVWL